jgi:hypothetical protein
VTVRADLGDDGSCLCDVLVIAMADDADQRWELGRVCRSGRRVVELPLPEVPPGGYRLELVFETGDALDNDGEDVHIDDLVIPGGFSSCP